MHNILYIYFEGECIDDDSTNEMHTVNENETKKKKTVNGNKPKKYWVFFVAVIGQ